ncbi:hypothetical protein ScalyP_jg812, partial [Parmales sp. scaly parma]
MQTPQTTPIAKYPTPTGTCTLPPSLLCGRSIISSNASLIAYCTKGGLIRVIDKQNGGKTLLRLHGTGDATAAAAASGRDERLGRSSLYDISFFPGKNDASVAAGKTPNSSPIIASVGNG